MRVKKKYYTAFIFDDEDRSDYHCTHKYLGELNDEQLEKVTQVVDAYCNVHDMTKELPAACFCKEAFFGAKQDIRVLLPCGYSGSWLEHLREQLSAFANDDYKSFNPHITTASQWSIAGKFTHYALMYKNVIIKKWPA